MAGLGGTFEPPLWSPNKGVGETFRTREPFFKSIADHPYRETLGLNHRASVASADFDVLLEQRPADVLVCHEAPSTRSDGEPQLDMLAEMLQVRLSIGTQKAPYRRRKRPPFGVLCRRWLAGEPDLNRRPCSYELLALTN